MLVSWESELHMLLLWGGNGMRLQLLLARDALQITQLFAAVQRDCQPCNLAVIRNQRTYLVVERSPLMRMG